MTDFKYGLNNDIEEEKSTPVMDPTKKLESWTNKLLDTGKRNNLISFKDTKSTTIELVYPDVESIFSKVESSFSFEVYDPKLMDTDDDEDDLYDKAKQDEEDDNSESSKNKRESYINNYKNKLKKQGQVLAYNQWNNSITVIKNLNRKAQSALEETGVNVLYMALGFIHWKESDNSKYEYKAPLILAPISFQNSSAISPFYIQMSEDDIIINPTFDYLLKAQYGVTLPTYEDGELQTYLNTIDGMVKKLGWYVSNECKVGLFSFLKINMYEDLKNNKDQLLRNANIRKLLGEDVPNGDNTYMEGEERAQVENELVDLHNVVDADSSQLEAILMAKSGKSFVLQGPPGTGKSQTITNIIAECLNDGKKVLFVSEKQAALNVVYDKLKKAGLEEFCLELHSHKANKKDVIEELNRTLKTAKTAVSQRANTEIDQKIKAQKELDLYEEELHKVREGINKSLYQLYEAYSACRTAPDIEFVIKDIQNFGEEDITEASNLLEQYVDYTPTIGEDYKKNAWYGYKNTNSSYQSVTELKNNMSSAKTMTDKLRKISAEVSSVCEVDTDSVYKMLMWKPIFSFLGSSEYITPALLARNLFNEDIRQLRGLSMFAEEIMSSKRDIDFLYDEDIYKLDATLINKKLSRQFTGSLSRVFNGEYKGIINSIRLCRKDGKKISYAEALRITELLERYGKKAEEFRNAEDKIRDHVGEGYKGLNTDWSQMKEQLDYLSRLHDSGISFGKIAEMPIEKFKENRSAFTNVSKAITGAFRDYETSYKEVDKNFDKSIIDLESASFNIIYKKLERCLAEIDRYDNWCGFVNLFDRLREKNITPFINLCNNIGIPAVELPQAYRKSFYKQWIDYVLFQTSGSMSNFNRVAHDKAVEIFKQKDELQFEISKVQIRSKLSQMRPSLDFVSGGSALQILLREGEKKRKQKSIRKLFEETGDLVQTLKPCFLMSPLSVSTFLSSAGIRFDVVVFDEASQIFPQDAIGAIYRGKQLIVVGDSKQMPPTNFFVSSIEGDEDEEEVGDINDFESILDLCSTSMPQKRLKWHYRSKFEQLISFSNKNFYDGELISFPSSKTDAKWLGVDYYYIDGLFEHKAGRNVKEAEFVVDLIYENIKRYPNRSLGVVAFSIRQQDIIERLLFKRRQEDPSHEDFFGKDHVEPFFIKNLETVQGDERDTIIFSTAYGRDNQGRILQNFGPINRVGGERRLNVAVTRAKINIQLVSSMHSTDITVKEMEKGGKRLFREYLDYAEHGEIALARSVTVNAFEEFDSEFEREVYDFLKEKGYYCDTQVGVSNFKIDIGLRRGENTDYVLAIECDGASYHSSRNARDRDRLRQSILEGMGWKFYRIWSTDWFRNTAVEKQRLLDAVEVALSTKDNSPKATTEKKTDIIFEKTIQEKHLRFPEYVKADDEAIMRNAFNQMSVIKEIVKLEAPISEEWLLKRIVTMFGKTKVTNVVRQDFDRLMYRSEKIGIKRKKGFLYTPDNKYVLRVPAQGGEKREIKYISLEELAVGMWVIIQQNVTVDKDGLFATITKELGFQRMGDAIIERLNDALAELKPLIVIDGNNISLKA